MVANYTYDAWGECTIVSDTTGIIARVNPYRYRGYYFDQEIGLYYLQSRYYDAGVGRFVNSDNSDTLELATQSDYFIFINLFTYCANNPTNFSDTSGMWLARLICGVTSAAIWAILGNLICRVVGQFVYVNSKTKTVITLAAAALGGVIGAVFGPSFMARHTPNLLRAINQLEKTRFSLKAIGPNTSGNIFGIVISNTLIIMLHAPHPKYNEWYFHIQVEYRISKRNQILLWKQPIYYVNSRTWRWK